MTAYGAEGTEPYDLDIAVPDREINRGLVYFTEDTFGDRIQDKWLKFVGEYEVFPKIPKDVCVSEGMIVPVSVNVEEILNIHKKIVERCNYWLDSADTKVEKRLKQIEIQWFK
ncbi:MAG: hypothetical protein HFG73_07985 [Hungatella sp.]|nr:hypothetical protein [Hungatella sp.]